VKPHRFHPAADAEYAAAATYYANIDSELGVRFYDEMERLIRDVRKQPERFWKFDPPVRRHRSTVFPYSVVFLDKSDHIWIVAMMHGKQHPDYWRKRLT
jgi:plasmid stabilization system protein ParE